MRAVHNLGTMHFRISRQERGRNYKAVKKTPLLGLGMMSRLILLLTLGFCPLSGSAQTLSYQFNGVFITSPPDPTPPNSAPWVDATFTTLSPGTVQLTISNVDVTSTEFIKGKGNGSSGGLFFNLSPALDVSNLDFSVVSATGSYSPSVSLSEAQLGYGFMADGDGEYDIEIDFGSQFGSDASITFDITGTNMATLDATAFAYLSTEGGGAGEYYAAAHLQGLPGGNSTWLQPTNGPVIIPVPEPVPSAILAMGAGLLFSARLWRRRMKA